MVTVANWGVLHDPTSSILPVNWATGAPVAVVYNGSIIPVAEAAVVIVVPLMLEVPDEDPDLEPLEPDPPLLLLDEVTAQPRKFGIVTLTPLQSFMLNARASVDIFKKCVTSFQQGTYSVDLLWNMSCQDNRRVR